MHTAPLPVQLYTHSTQLVVLLIVIAVDEVVDVVIVALTLTTAVVRLTVIARRGRRMAWAAIEFAV